MRRVAVVGVAQTRFERRIIDRNCADLVYEVTTGALKDAGMTIGQIDNVITVSNDFWDGRTISSMAVTDACGSYGKNVSTVEGDGTFGVLYGAMRIWSGSFGTTLVVAHSKSSEGLLPVITNAMFDPIYYRPLGLDAISSAALQARAYIDRRGADPEDWAYVSVKNHKNAKLNPYAQLPIDLTVEQVMASPLLADPIKLFDCSPISDGAAAVILAGEDQISVSNQKPVWLKGVGYAAELNYLGDRDLSEPRALLEGAKRAYMMAGIINPKEELDFLEIYDAFSYMEPLWLEGLGVCDRGEGGKLTRRGITGIEGRLPVNASGGVLSAHAVLVAGLVRVIEVVHQIRGTAGAHQLERARTGLAHGINGPCAQSHCVWILGRD
ncbi:MAG: thiolase family protein [Thermodesulfobacteriota bacterium]